MTFNQYVTSNPLTLVQTDLYNAKNGVARIDLAMRWLRENNYNLIEYESEWDEIDTAQFTDNTVIFIEMPSEEDFENNDQPNERFYFVSKDAALLFKLSVG